MDSFTIYKEYFDLITFLPKKEQGELLVAICNYMLFDKEPNLNENEMKIFRNLKRPLDKSKIKSKNRKIAKQIQNEIKSKLNQNRNETETKLNQIENETKTHQDGSGNVNVYVFNNIKELINYIQDKLNYKLNNIPIEINTLNYWLENKIPKEVIKYAFEEAKRKCKGDINYINGIVVKRFEEFKKKQQEDNSELPIWFNGKIEKDTEGLEELEDTLKEFNEEEQEK